jgi:hypothetical protein
MSHFAQITNGIVSNVIVIESSVLAQGHWGDPSTWKQCSYNTRGGVHYGQDGKPDGGVALRGNYPGIGYTYDATNDVFYPTRPVDHKGVSCASWTIGAPTWTWTPPTAMPTTALPTGEMYVWDEATKAWETITLGA